MGDYCFNVSRIRQIAIPSGITVIPSYAFRECNNLESVVFLKDSKLERIENSAFMCTGLKEFVCPSTLKVISYGAFAGSANLKHIELNAGIQDMDYFCFAGTQLADVKLPAQIKRTP